MQTSFRQTFETDGYLLVRQAEQTLEDFVRLTEQWGREFLTLKSDQSAGPRQIVGSHLGRTPLPGYDSVFLAAGQGATFSLPLHGELYYQMQFPPELLCFFCHIPPQTQGETLLCDGSALFEALPSDFQERLRSEPISYTRYSGPEWWQRDYGSTDAAAVTRFLLSQGLQADIDPQTQVLKTVFTTSALRTRGDRVCFINNVIPFVLRERHEPEATQSRVRFANGEPFPAPWIDSLLATAQKLQKAISWQTGDILLVDNRRTLHGRETLLEGPRTLYLRMAAQCR
ncbi:MAG: TauD/TfdA family dioxygenase [Candidatus Sericytochromatia bacterium]